MRNRSVPVLRPEEADYVRSFVVHDDDAVLAFNKPSGLAVQTRGGRGRSLDHLLWAFAKSNGKRPRLVHRLDTGTSGIMVVGRTQPAAAHLSDSFAKRRARKTYVALARGDLPDDGAGTIDQPLLKCEGQRGVPPMVASDDPAALAASTHWRILARAGDTALFELRPKTGRMHQIRAHLRHLNCPILGDPLYGAGGLSGARLMLHAARLVIAHPQGDDLDLSAPIPADMAAAIEIAGLEAPAESA